MEQPSKKTTRFNECIKLGKQALYPQLMARCGSRIFLFGGGGRWRNLKSWKNLDPLPKAVTKTDIFSNFFQCFKAYFEKNWDMHTLNSNTFEFIIVLCRISSREIYQR